MAFGEGPALAVGNSLDDGDMLSYARGLALVSNPNSAAIEVLARDKGWSVHHLGFPRKRDEISEQASIYS